MSKNEEEIPKHPSDVGNDLSAAKHPSDVGNDLSAAKHPSDIGTEGAKYHCRNEAADFVKALVAITLVSILVSIWSRTIINFTSYTLGFGENNTWGFAIVAIILTIILIIYVLIILDTETSKSVRATLVGAGIAGGNQGAQSGNGIIDN